MATQRPSAKSIRELLTAALLALPLAASLAGTTVCQSKASPQEACDNSTVDDWGQAEATKARAFLATLKSVVQAHDRTKLALMIAYPLNVFAPGRKQVIHNRAEFIEKYPSVFSSHIKHAILT